jgi:hypothetical protein
VHATPTAHAKPKAHAEPKAHSKPKEHTKPKAHTKPKVDAKPKEHTKPEVEVGPKARAVALRLASPKQPVVPGRTNEWTFAVTAKGPGKPTKAVFRMTLPKSLAFVSGGKRCKPAGRTVVCRLGALKNGQRATGTIMAKVSRRAEPGETIRPRGTVEWGRTRASVMFPPVRVARTPGLALAKR